MNKDLYFEQCNFRFKGNSCYECPLDCMYKNKSQRINEQQTDKTEEKIWEDLYYKENSEKAIYMAQVEYLKKQVSYLKSRLYHLNKYKEYIHE